MRIRALIVAAAVAVPLVATAPSSSAVWCPEDPPRIGRDCCGGIVNDVWIKLFGGPLIMCMNQ